MSRSRSRHCSLVPSVAWADSPERYSGIRRAVGPSTLVGMSMSIGALRGAGERRGTVDHGFARRMLVNEYKRGRLSRDQVCDAHPELIRAATHVGSPLDQPCPICEESVAAAGDLRVRRPPAGPRSVRVDGQGDGDAQPPAGRAVGLRRRGLRRLPLASPPQGDPARGLRPERQSLSGRADGRPAAGTKSDSRRHRDTPFVHAGGMLTSRRYTRPVIFTLPRHGAPRSHRRPGPKGGCHA